MLDSSEVRQGHRIVIQIDEEIGRLINLIYWLRDNSVECHFKINLTFLIANSKIMLAHLNGIGVQPIVDVRMYDEPAHIVSACTELTRLGSIKGFNLHIGNVESLPMIWAAFKAKHHLFLSDIPASDLDTRHVLELGRKFQCVALETVAAKVESLNDKIGEHNEPRILAAGFSLRNGEVHKSGTREAIHKGADMVLINSQDLVLSGDPNYLFREIIREIIAGLDGEAMAQGR